VLLLLLLLLLLLYLAVNDLEFAHLLGNLEVSVPAP